MRNGQVLWCLTAALWVMSGCAGTQPETPTHSVRDSAGIEIVENGAPAWAERSVWRLSDEPLFIIHASDGSDENLLLDPASIDVDSRGRIIVADGDQAGWEAVLVFDSLGRFLMKMGGEGQGPGEFGQLWWASTYREDSVAAFDMSGDWLRIFDPEGRYVRQLRTPQYPMARPPEGTYGYTDGIDAAFANGDFLGYPRGYLDTSEGPGPAWYRHLLLRVSPDGETWDTLGVFEISQEYWSGTRQETLWYSPIAVKAIWEDRFYFGVGESFELGLHDRDGRLIRIIRRAYEPRLVTEADKDNMKAWYLERVSMSPEVNEEMLERLRQQMETAQYAETIPPYTAALVDWEGNLWVEEFRWYTANERAPVIAPTHWSVFDASGRWLGQVETPAGFILREVTDDRALGFVVDEYDVKEVHVYGLVKPGM